MKILIVNGPHEGLTVEVNSEINAFSLPMDGGENHWSKVHAEYKVGRKNYSGYSKARLSAIRVKE